MSLEIGVKASGEWLTVETVIPRAHWPFNAVNLAPFLIEGTDIEARVLWTDHHKRDYMGLDTSDGETVVVTAYGPSFALASNDYFDLDVDRVNSPERPLPSGRITVRELTVIAALLSVAGLATAALLGPPALTLAAVTWAVGLLYNWKGKEAGLPGNVMVSFSVAMTFVLGGVAVGGLTSGVVWTFEALAFLFDLAEEIAGGAMDVKGDERRSAKTLARMKGRTYALGVSSVIFAFFIGLTFSAGSGLCTSCSSPPRTSPSRTSPSSS